MKKKLLLLAAMLICATVFIQGTLAYFTDDTQVHNVITTDAVDIEIEEWQETEDGLVPYPDDEPVHVMPGTTLSKVATVKNNEAEAYIRAKAEVVITDENGRVMELSQERLESIVTVYMNESAWIRKDGDAEWWYCVDKIPTDVSTAPLFSEVKFDGPNMTNEYQNCTVEVIVDAQAVQTANNGSTVLEAAGWPAK